MSALAAVLSVDKSTASRHVASLKKRGLVTLSRGPSGDTRLKWITLTALGRDHVRDLHESQRDIISRTLACLSAKEQSRLAFLLRSLADGLSAPPAIAAPRDHPVTLELVRVARALGMTGTRFVSGELSSTQYHALNITEMEPPQTVSSLSARLPFDKSTVSRTMASLLKKGLLKVQESVADRRVKELLLTPQGRRLVDDQRRLAVDTIAQGLCSRSSDEVRELSELLTRICRAGADLPDTVVKEELEIRKLASAKEFNLARGMLIEHLLRSNRHFEAPEVIFSRKSTAYGIFVNGQLKGACEILSGDNSKEIANFAPSAGLDENYGRRFLEAVRKMI